MFPLTGIDNQTGEISVLVVFGDTVILNCTCYQQNESTWTGPRKLISNGVEDGDKQNELIAYSVGLVKNPKLSKFNFEVIGSYEKGECNLEVHNFSSKNEGTYRCQYFSTGTLDVIKYKLLGKSK